MRLEKGTKRICNPMTGRCYRIRRRTSNKGVRGTIMGEWKPPTELKKRKRSEK